MSTETKTLFSQAETGNLPKGFDDWGMNEFENGKGRTLAHVAAANGHLPPDFSNWGGRDNQGNTVAHAAAANGHLPDESFNEWDAGQGVGYGWSLINDASVSIAEVYKRGCL